MSRADVPQWPNGSLKLGPCCACRADNDTVRNIIMIARRAPVPRTGWGCYVCELKNDGAIAVLCNACVQKAPEVEFLDVCHGYPSEGRRSAYAALDPEPFEHDRTRHEAFEETFGGND